MPPLPSPGRRRSGDGNTDVLGPQGLQLRDQGRLQDDAAHLGVPVLLRELRRQDGRGQCIVVVQEVIPANEDIVGAVAWTCWVEVSIHEDGACGGSFERYAAMLTAFDAQGAAALWATPGTIIDKTFAGVVEDRETMARGLEQSYPTYQSSAWRLSATNASTSRTSPR